MLQAGRKSTYGKDEPGLRKDRGRRRGQGIGMDCVCACVYMCGISRSRNAQKVLLKVRPVRSEGLAHLLRPWHQDSAFPPRSADGPLSQAEQGGGAGVAGHGVG